MPTAVEFFLKLDKIDGESTDKVHPGEIFVESFSWGLNHAGNGNFGSGGGAGRASFQDFSFVTRVSKASPQLMLACATGRHIANGVFSGRLTNSMEFYQVKLTDILVSSFKDVSDSQLGAHDGFPMSEVSLNFAKILFSVTPMQGGIGTASPPVSFDVQRNVEG